MPRPINVLEISGPIHGGKHIRVATEAERKIVFMLAEHAQQLQNIRRGGLIIAGEEIGQRSVWLPDFIIALL
ncbi:MAG: hypothetical protein OSB69_13345 [Alphaproteobacteria bacterium]|nr:hypothetical protein [Alphaproteobacteria bacterium]